MIKKTCSRKKCYQDRDKGDTLFCNECRKEWREFCDKLIGKDTQAPEEDVNLYLKTFQNS